MKVDRAAAPIIRLISEFPEFVIERVERGKHLKIFMDTPFGKKILTVGVTSSCDKAMKNNRSILRRWSKGA